MTEEPMVDRAEGVYAFVEQIDEKHDKAHTRLRQDLREHEGRFTDAIRLLNERQQGMAHQVNNLANTPMDISKVAFAPRVVVGVIAVVMSVAGAFHVTTSGLRSDVRDILTRMATEQRVADANAKLLEQNGAMIKDALSVIGKRQDLLTLQYNELNDKITRLTAQRERP